MLAICEEAGAAALPSASQLFQRVVLPHLNEAHGLVRYLTGCRADADDVLQEASVRMLRFVHNYRGGDARSWVLSVARNTAFSWLRAKRRSFCSASGENAPALPMETALDTAADESEEAFAVEARRREAEALRRVIDRMPRGHREAIVLRDLGGLDYAEIASKLQLPIGTVMSRVSRGRAALKQLLIDAGGRKAPSDRPARRKRSRAAITSDELAPRQPRRGGGALTRRALDVECEGQRERGG